MFRIIVKLKHEWQKQKNSSNETKEGLPIGLIEFDKKDDFIPVRSRKDNVKKIFNFSESGFGWKDPGEIFKINKVEQLFPRVSNKDFFSNENGEKEKKMEDEKISEDEGLINFDYFKKVEMVVAKVIDVKKVENTDKLLELIVDTGTDKRTLVAGIAQYYKVEDLNNKKIIIVKNLKPIKLRGILSQGMILAASDANGRPYIPIIPEETPVGAILK